MKIGFSDKFRGRFSDSNVFCGMENIEVIGPDHPDFIKIIASETFRKAVEQMLELHEKTQKQKPPLDEEE